MNAKRSVAQQEIDAVLREEDELFDDYDDLSDPPWLSSWDDACCEFCGDLLSEGSAHVCAPTPGEP